MSEQIVFVYSLLPDSILNIPMAVLYLGSRELIVFEFYERVGVGIGEKG